MRGQKPGGLSRKWRWQAIYLDGEVLDEHDERGRGARWEAVERGRLARVHLLEAVSGFPEVALDCATGIFTVRGRRLEFQLGPDLLTGQSCGCYRDVHQYKSAHADWRDGRASGTVVDAYHLGYRATFHDVRFRPVLRLDARTLRVTVHVELAPLQACIWTPRDLVVLVDGRPWSAIFLGSAPPSGSRSGDRATGGPPAGAAGHPFSRGGVD